MNDLDNLDIGKGGTMGGDALVGLFDKPNKMFENALSSLTKKTASTAWGKFKKQLATASEPIFRKDMGERYLSSANLYGGCLIWALTTLAALSSPSLRSPAFIVSKMMEWDNWAQMVQSWPFACITLAIGGALTFFNFTFGIESVMLMRRYRDAGTAYHSMSRGTPRWGEVQVFVMIFITLALFLFDMPAGILFFVSICMSGKLAMEQQEAIYNRYLDALDTKIEQEYLEDAILGQCPTQITQLTHPLPPDLNSDLRTNIAAAAVGKPIKMMAQAPKGKTPTTAVSSTTPTPPTPTPVPRQSSGQPGRLMPTVNFQSLQAQTPTTSTDDVVQQQTSKQRAKASLAPQPTASTASEPIGSKSAKPIPWMGILLLAVAAVLGCFIGVLHNKRGESVKVVAMAQPATPLANAVAESAVKPTPEPSQPPVVLTATVQEPPAQVPAVATTTNPVEATTPPIVQAPPPEAKPEPTMAEIQQQQQQHDADKITEQLKSILQDQAAQLEKFKAYCAPKMNSDSRQIPDLKWLVRSSFKKQNDTLQDKIGHSAATYKQIISTWQQRFSSIPSSDLSALQTCLEEFTPVASTMTSQRAELISELDAISEKISKAANNQK